MASNNYTLNTWYAKRIIGDAGAENDALLQLTNNNTLILTNRSNVYNIKYLYDSTNGNDKIEFYGGQQENNVNVPSAWIQLNTGDLYVLGNVGIGHEPDTYKLYVNGTSYFTNTITINNGCVNGEVIRIIGAANKVFSFKLSGDQTPGSNVDIGWNWTNVEGAGAAFRSTSFGTQEGEFRIYARKRNSSDVAVYTQLIGTPGDTIDGGNLSWGGSASIGASSSDGYKLYVNGTGFFSGFLTVRVNGESGIQICDGKHYNNDTFRAVLDLNPDNGNHGIWSSGYLNGTTFTSDGKWLLVRSSDGSVQMNGNAATATALTSNAGSGEQPIYFTGGKPSATSYALKATVNNGDTGYVAYYSSERAISSAKATNGMLMPGHYYHNLYNDNPITGTTAYVHYYNTGTTSTNTFANLRVKSGSTYKTLAFGGDGTFTWNGTSVVINSGTWDISITGNAATATKWAAAQTVYVTLGTASTTTTLQGGSSSAQTIGVNGTLAVGNGGTGATSFTANCAIISGSTTTSALTTRGIRNNTTVGALGWTANATDITLTTTNTIAYWNGAYSGTSSNLAYCNKGAFGDMATKTASDYATAGHTHTLSLAATGTASINLAANTVYTLTAGGKTYAFKTPADANTDTNTWRPVQNNVTSTSTTDCLSAAQGKALADNCIKTISRSGTTFTATRYNGGTFTFTQQDNNTDTNTWRPVVNNLTSTATDQSLSAAQGKALADNCIKNITRSGTTFTATRYNGGTFTFTQQDNNTNTWRPLSVITYTFTYTIAANNGRRDITATNLGFPGSGTGTPVLQGIDPGSSFVAISRVLLHMSGANTMVRLINTRTASFSDTLTLRVAWFGN